MSNEEYMRSKFKHINSWKEAVYDDSPVILVWCNNYRQQKKLMNELYHEAAGKFKDRCDIIHHANTIKFRHINKKFVFQCNPIKFMGYSRYTASYMDWRFKDEI